MPLNILLLFDLGESVPSEYDYSEELSEPVEDEWKSEASVLTALRSLGHRVKPFGLCDDLAPLIDEVRRSRPDLIFNLSEAFRGDRALEPNLPAFLELMGISYTGARPAALQLCKDKGLAKKILSYHGIRTPRFEVSLRARPLRALRDLVYPAIVKPLGLESSLGISNGSLVSNESAALERVRHVHERLQADAIVEEFIEGRELYVSVFGGAKIEVFEPRELFFDRAPPKVPRFATYKAKWDDEYRSKWGISTGPARGISKEFGRKIAIECRRIYEVLGISGYARLDLRMTSALDLVFIEANPNPSIAFEDDFAQSAIASGVSYEKLIARIVAGAK